MKLYSKLRELITIEKLRYQRKGVINTVIAITLLFLIIKSANLFFRAVWPAHVENSTQSVTQRNCSSLESRAVSISSVSFCISAFICPDT